MREIYEAVIQIFDKRNGRQFELKLEDCIFGFYQRNGIFEISGKPLDVNKNIADLPVRFRPYSRNMDGARFITTASSLSCYESFLKSLQRQGSLNPQNELERHMKYEEISQWLSANPILVSPSPEEVAPTISPEENLQKAWEDMMLAGLKQVNK
ncbi:MAG: hypothetical protein ACI4M6_05390 [Christensenellaceae bacterium]